MVNIVNFESLRIILTYFTASELQICLESPDENCVRCQMLKDQRYGTMSDYRPTLEGAIERQSRKSRWRPMDANAIQIHLSRQYVSWL